MIKSTETEIQCSTKIEEPRFFKVILLNDDYTPMDFVVSVLREIFHKGAEEATALMLEVHNNGSSICGVYPKDVAESKALRVVNVAGRNGYPLQCKAEEEN